MPELLANSLQQAIDRELPNLRGMSDGHAGAARPGRSWTRKQELGHLIDSATNNHARFVCGTLQDEFRGPGYNQDGWVALHAYNDLPWPTLVDFWYRHNALLAHLVHHIPEDQLATACYIAKYPKMTLGFVIEDYILHMQHHLDQILDREQVTQYPGAAIPEQKP
jgi:DinB superfamily